jgi:hypothetical protein
MEVELGASPFEGFRIFGLDHKQSLLTSIAYPDIWVPGEVKESDCKIVHKHGHLKPHDKCTCGIWAVKSRRAIHRSYPRLAAQQMRDNERRTVPPLPQTGMIFQFWVFYPQRTFLSARIQLWGTVIEHQWGYRGEYAQIIPESIQWWPRIGSYHKPKLLAHLREKYAAQIPSDGGQYGTD